MWLSVGVLAELTQALGPFTKGEDGVSRKNLKELHLAVAEVCEDKE